MIKNVVDAYSIYKLPCIAKKENQERERDGWRKGEGEGEGEGEI